MNTLIGKLKGLDFFVYVYQLDSPRDYEDFNPQTVGIGYVGAEDSDDIETGMERLMEVSRWLRKHLPYLQEQHQKDFPNQSQYAAVNQMEKDYSLLISGETMDEITGRVWIESHLLGRDEPIEERIAQLENTPVTIEYRRI